MGKEGKKEDKEMEQEEEKGNEKERGEKKEQKSHGLSKYSDLRSQDPGVW